MTNQEFTTLLKHPERVSADSVPHLKELVEQYPYFAPARMLYLRGLQQSDSIHFEKALNEASLYCHDRRWLYYYIYPEKKIEKKQAYTRSENKSGDYFDMLDSVEKDGGDVSQSLKILAERLKSARMNVLSDESFVTPEEKPQVVLPDSPIVDESVKVLQHGCAEEDYAEKVRLLMKRKRYEETLEILKELNLNNPKKSIYFADQIRFLEKVIDNIKK